MFTLTPKRFYVKIIAGKLRQCTETIYYRTDLPFNIFNKWQWYFKYREALYRIKNPRYYIELSMGSYDYVPPKEEVIKILINKIRAKKGKITEYKTKIRIAEQTWDEMFSIAENDLFKKAKAKIERYQIELTELEIELMAKQK